MTNIEKFKENIVNMIFDLEGIGIKNGKPVCCSSLNCFECDFYDDEGTCKECFTKWMNEEYKESIVDWTRIPIDAKILVRDNKNEKWQKRHFAGYENDKVNAWANAGTSWSSSKRNSWNFAKLAEDLDEE